MTVRLLIDASLASNVFICASLATNLVIEASLATNLAINASLATNLAINASLATNLPMNASLANSLLNVEPPLPVPINGLPFQKSVREESAYNRPLFVEFSPII